MPIIQVTIKSPTHLILSVSFKTNILNNFQIITPSTIFSFSKDPFMAQVKIYLSNRS